MWSRDFVEFCMFLVIAATPIANPDNATIIPSDIAVACITSLAPAVFITSAKPATLITTKPRLLTRAFKTSTDFSACSNLDMSSFDSSLAFLTPFTTPSITETTRVENPSLSAITREIVANGYLTQLGLFHHSVFNEFNFGSDLMEPYRPLVDSIVINLEAKDDLTHDDKMEILKVLNMKVKIDTITLTVLNSISYYVRSVFEAIENEDASFLRFYRYEF